MKQIGLVNLLACVVTAAAVLLPGPSRAQEPVPAVCAGRMAKSLSCTVYRGFASACLGPENQEVLAQAFLKKRGLQPSQAGLMRSFVSSLYTSEWIETMAGVFDNEKAAGKRVRITQAALEKFIREYERVCLLDGLCLASDADQKYFLQFWLDMSRKLPEKHCDAAAWRIHLETPPEVSRAVQTLMQEMSDDELERHLAFEVRMMRTGAGLEPSENAPGRNLDTAGARQVFSGEFEKRLGRLPAGERDEILSIFGNSSPSRPAVCRANEFTLDMALDVGEPDGPALRAWLIGRMTGIID